MRAATSIQLKLPGLKDHTRTTHGGDRATGRRKLARPVATKTPMHLVLRASRATGARSMLRPAHTHRISRLISEHADRNGIRIEQFANVGNHLHLLVRARSRRGFQNFLRTVTGLIARLVTGAVKGRASGRFWDHLAFSRVVKWGRDLRAVTRYVLQNAKEAWGIPTSRRPRRGFRGRLIGFEEAG